MNYTGVCMGVLLISGFFAGCAAHQQPSEGQPPLPVSSGVGHQQPSNDQPPPPLVSDLDQGLKLIEERDYAGGKAKLEEALRTQPTSSEAWFKLGRIYLDYYEDWNKAIECGERAVASGPNNSDYHEFLGEACARLAQRSGQTPKALQLAKKAKSEFEKAFELNPNSLLARRALMEYLAQAPKIAGGNWDEAKRIAEETLSMHASSAYIMLASLYRGRNENKKAEENYLMAIKTDPGNPWGHIDLGWFYFNEKRYEKARVHFQKYQELDPQDPHAFLNFGWFYVLTAKFAEAEIQIAKALEIQPRYVEAWYLLGQFHSRKGEKDRAQRAFQKCTALDGDNRWTGANRKRDRAEEKKDRNKQAEKASLQEYTVVGLLQSQQKKCENGKARTVYVVEDANGILFRLPFEDTEAAEFVGKRVKVVGNGVAANPKAEGKSVIIKEIASFEVVE